MLGGLLLLFLFLRLVAAPVALIVLVAGATSFAAMRGDMVDRDYPSYYTLYADSTVHAAVRGWAEFGYFGLQNLFSSHSVSFAIFLFLIGSVAIGAKVLALYINDREHLFIGLAVYFATYFLLHDMTQVRVSVSSGMFLLSLIALRRGRWLLFVMLNALAMTFHLSSVIGFVALLLRYHPRRYEPLVFALAPLLLTAVGIFGIAGGFSAAISSLAPDSRIELYMSLSEQGKYADINLLSIGFLILASLNALLWLRLLGQDEEPQNLLYLRVFSIGIMCYPLFSSLPVLAFRTSEYLCIVVLFLVQRYCRFLQYPAASLLVVLYMVSAIYVNIVRDESLLAPYSTEIHEL